MEPYSTLEHIKYDGASGGLEYDEAKHAHVNDDRIPYPVVSGRRPKFVHAESFPEVIPYAVDPARRAGDERSNFKSLPRCSSKRIFWIIFSLALVAIAVGLGVPFGIAAKKAQTSPSVWSYLHFHNLLPSSINHIHTYMHIRNNKPPPISQHHMLDDTSIAAISSSKGDRHIFFQDHTGTVRQTIYTASTKRWASPLSFVVAIDAKNHTPFAPVIDPQDNVILFYITANNTLSVKNFSGGGWQSNVTELVHSGFANRIAAPDSRDLSVTFVPGGQDLNVDVPASKSSIPQLLLFYENQSGNISSLLLDVVPGPQGPSHRWKDVSTSLYSSQPDAKFGSPFNSVLASEGFRGFAEAPLVTTPSVNKSTGAYVRTVFHDLSGSDRGLNSNSIVFSHYANGNFTTGSRVNITGPSLPQSDIVQPGLPSGNLAIAPLCAAWVNGSALSPICPLDVPNPPQNAPISAYPFKRLASTTAPNSTIFYIYHQLDAVTFAEDWWDQEGSGGWMTSKFSIETV